MMTLSVGPKMPDRANPQVTGYLATWARVCMQGGWLWISGLSWEIPVRDFLFHEAAAHQLPRSS